jgi:hypothetical protein
MPLYFFDSHDGLVEFRDEIGTDCAHHDAACIKAVRAMAELARQYFPASIASKPDQSFK